MTTHDNAPYVKRPARLTESRDSVLRNVRQQEIRVPIWWKPMTRREREVMQRVLERHARELVASWDIEDANAR